MTEAAGGGLLRIVDGVGCAFCDFEIRLLLILGDVLDCAFDEGRPLGLAARSKTSRGTFVRTEAALAGALATCFPAAFAAFPVVFAVSTAAFAPVFAAICVPLAAGKIPPIFAAASIFAAAVGCFPFKPP